MDMHIPDIVMIINNTAIKCINIFPNPVTNNTFSTVLILKIIITRQI
jgi:hypothetical protein